MHVSHSAISDRTRHTGALTASPHRTIRSISLCSHSQTFVISYVKSSGVVKHHRLYYTDGLLTPQGSNESFDSIHDLLHKKGFLGGGAFLHMPDASDAVAPSPIKAPRSNLPGLGAPAARVQQQQLQHQMQQQSGFAAPPGNYMRVDPLPPTGTAYIALGGAPAGPMVHTNYGNLGSPDASSAGSVAGVMQPASTFGSLNQPYGVLSPGPQHAAAGAVPVSYQPNYGNVSAGMHSNYTDISAHASQFTPYAGMPPSGQGY